MAQVRMPGIPSDRITSHPEAFAAGVQIRWWLDRL